MASTSTEPQTGVLDEINALFSWNPPLLSSPENKPSTDSTAIRPPGFYDKHLSEQFVLRRVKSLPSLVPDLAKNVHKALDAALQNLPPLCPDFITAARRKSDLRRYSREAKDERAVANIYDNYAANYCLPVASTLALHPTASFSEWSSLLRWTHSVSSEGYAIVDGELHFERDTGFEEDIVSHRASIVGTMEDNVRRIFTEMRDSRAPLATWEMNSLAAGAGEVMSVVPNLGTFSWTFCDCRKVPKHRKPLTRGPEMVVGPDWQDPPWSLPLTSEAGPSIDPPPSLGPNYWSMSSPSSLTSLSTDDNDEGANDTRMKRKKNNAPPKNNSKRHKRDDDDENKDKSNNGADDEDNMDEEYIEEEQHRNRHDLTAHNLVQQAWAQATRVDGTVIVLHSGNHELVCIRHRASQTLYVSEVIEPHSCVDPAYGKLQVGIYVAAIQDALDRKQHPKPPVPHVGALTSGSKGKNKNQGSWGKPEGRHGVAKHDRFQGSAAENDPTDGELALEVRCSADLSKPDEHQNLVHEASNRDVVCVYFRYGIYDSHIPAWFLRSAPSIMAPTTCLPSPQIIRHYSPEGCLTIGLTSEIGRGATGVVHRGTLMPEIWQNATPLDVVVKLAFDIEQRKELRSEYGIYRRLRLKGVNEGVTTALGFFDDAEDGACALVMLYAGVPLSTDLQGSLSISDCKSALSVLDTIHCAGILHGDISPENILISDLGITIIDFGHSTKCNNRRAKDEELAQLRDLLGESGWNSGEAGRIDSEG